MKKIMTALIGLGLVCGAAYADDMTATSSTSSVTASNPQDAAAKNLAMGQAFLNKNKNKAGVITLPDGLQYKVVTKGKGPLPKSTDTVTVDYAGTSIDGTEFDSSYKRGEPATFPVNGVIPGWTEALQMMPVGSTWELYIPAELAYGLPGAPPSIGPNETLVFKVKLISIN